MIEEIKTKLNQPRYSRASNLFKRSLVKEWLIPYLLRFIYRDKRYQRLVFYGGTCAHLIYGLERLSEDIDLHNPGVNLKGMEKDLESYMQKELEFKGALIYKQGGDGGIKRLVVRLPILFELGLTPNEGEKLHLKLEISDHNQIYKEKVSPLTLSGLVMVLRHFDETSLMAGKIVACLRRVRMRGERLSVKGRDWYDLWWWLKRGTEPDWVKIGAEIGCEGWNELKKLIEKKLESLDLREIEADLLPFWEEPEYVRVWVSRMREEIEMMLAKKY